MPSQKNVLIYHCPSCGYPGLDSKPYNEMPQVIDLSKVKPPYCEFWGNPSYEVCDCCGFEFGFDDDPGGTAKAETFDEYLAHWISKGCQWFTPKKRPHDWSIEDQLESAGIKIPIKLTFVENTIPAKNKSIYSTKDLSLEVHLDYEEPIQKRLDNSINQALQIKERWFMLTIDTLSLCFSGEKLYLKSIDAYTNFKYWGKGDVTLPPEHLKCILCNRG